MRLPIQYSMLYPKRAPNAAIQKFDAVAAGEMTFKPLDPSRYPCFELALEVAKRGGTWPAVLNGADEMAVEAFLDGRIKFTDIPVVIERALQDFTSKEDPTIDDIIEASTWGKERVEKIARM